MFGMRSGPGPGPVFGAECLTASRRVSFYGARVLLVLALLVGLGVVWASHRIVTSDSEVQNLARIGSSFYSVIVGIELALALLVAPAATAGSICDDRANGSLALLMTTDLSDSEIALGRLASRLLSMLGVIACGLPVLALTTLLGGVDPLAIAGGTLVVVGVATLSITLALTFSLWAGKAHEAQSATYAFWTVWILGFEGWRSMVGPTTEWLRWLNPFWLLFSNWSIGYRLPQQCAFLAFCLMFSALLAGFSTRKLRAATIPGARRSGRQRSEPRVDRRRPGSAGSARPARGSTTTRFSGGSGIASVLRGSRRRSGGRTPWAASRSRWFARSASDSSRSGSGSRS